MGNGKTGGKRTYTKNRNGYMKKEHPAPRTNSSSKEGTKPYFMTDSTESTRKPYGEASSRDYKKPPQRSNTGKYTQNSYNHKGKRPAGKPRTKAPVKVETIEQIMDAIKKSVSENTSDKYYFRWKFNTKKIESNVVSGTIKFSLREDQSKYKYIGIIIIQDMKKTNHVIFFDDNMVEKDGGQMRMQHINVLFNTTTRTPIAKLNEYMPRIFKTVQELIS